MPYIRQVCRPEFDDQISLLALQLSKLNDEKDVTGSLNYIITSLIIKTLSYRYEEIKYWMIAMMTGVLINVKDEFYRRVAASYEDKKIKENGDVY